MANADRIINLLHEAKARPAGAERERFLAEACGDDAAFKEQILSLLQADSNDADLNFLTIPSLARETIVLTEKAGDKIGRYKLLQQIGEGGCGVVYMAEQEEPVRRRVALKVIKLGMDTKSVIARFEAERQALALMDHPNIAKVLDAGATETGRPYFVMELVRGIKVTDFCDQNQFSTEDRLKLFTLVCQAIQHAHQKGVIHRDIKPSNILVTSQDGVPVPKVIDFGIAKATTDQRLTDKTVFTAFEQFIGTPAYMSPEQAEMSALDIDTRSDIYSLGVLLYELLTGSPPFDQKELLAAGLDRMRRIIREEEPIKPSTRLTQECRAHPMPAGKSEIQNRKSEIDKDLDWIAMKCLEKDRTRRYETANALAADIRRHLENEPVVARPPSRLYEFQKTMRRHKFGFAAATSLALVLMLGVVISTWQAVRATKAEELANDRLAQVAAERDAKEQALQTATKAEQLANDRLAQVELARQDAEAISSFMSEVIQSPDPTRDGRTIQVVELLDRAAKRLDTELAGQPEQKAKLQTTLGLTYASLGLCREAIPLQEKARDYYQAAFGPEHAITVKVMHDLAGSYREAGRLEDALKLDEEVLAIRRKANGPEHPLTLTAMHSLAHGYRDVGRNAEALKLLEAALPLMRKLDGPEHKDTLHLMNCLAASYADVGRSAEAFKMREEVLPLSRKVNGPEHPQTLMMMANLANSYAGRGRRDEALKLREEILPVSRKIFGPEHPRTIGDMFNLAGSYRSVGRLNEAIQMYESCLQLYRRASGPTNLYTLNAMTELAISYRVAGRNAEAITLEEESLRLKREHLRPGHPYTIESIENLAKCYDKADRKAEAELLRKEARELKANNAAKEKQSPAELAKPPK